MNLLSIEKMNSPVNMLSYKNVISNLWSSNVKKLKLVVSLLSITLWACLSVLPIWAAEQTIGFSYSEGLAFNKIDMLNYDTKFESIEVVNDNTTNEVTFKKNNYKFFVGYRAKFGPLPELEIRGLIEHYNFHAKNVIDAECKFGPGVEAILGAGGFINFHVGYTYCKSELKQSEVYILDTTSPTKNPYDNSMNKFTRGFSLTLEDPSIREKKWGMRFTYSLETIELKIYGVNRDSDPENPTFQMYGVDFYTFM